MAISFSQQDTIQRDSTYQIQVKRAILTAAINIAAEAATAHQTVDEKRHTLAVAVLTDANTCYQRFADAIATQLVSTSPSDGDIGTIVGGVWNALAGVAAVDSV